MNVFTEVLDETTYVSFHKIDSKAEKTYQILVRPDLTEDCLLSLAQQILITYCGQVQRHLPESSHEINGIGSKDGSRVNPGRNTPDGNVAADSKQSAVPNQNAGQERILSPYLESTNATTTAQAIPWQSLRVYLGANMDLQRCLVLAVKPTAAASGPNVNTTQNTDARLSARIANAGIFSGIGANTFTALQLQPTTPETSKTTTTSTTASSAGYISPARRSFLEFCDNLATELNTAMREESLTLDYMHSVPAQMTGPVQALSYGGSGMGGGGAGLLGSGSGVRAPDSIIDIGFIRDLHCATIQLMSLRLLEQAERLDHRVRIIEQKCARLMTLLKPSYQRARLDMPTPPAPRPLSQYPLSLPSSWVLLGDCLSVEHWRSMVLSARRKCKAVFQARSQFYMNGGGRAATGQTGSKEQQQQAPDTRTEAQVVLDCITEHFVELAQREYKPRLFRKIMSVRDRLETIHRFRIQLLLSLHERFVVTGQAHASGISTSTASSSSWLFGSSESADLAYQRSVREKFPFLELTNPVIFDTPAILLSGERGLFDSAAAALNGKSGTLYVSLDYLMFYAGGGLLFAAPDIVAVPLRSVVLLEVVDAEGTVVGCRYAGEDHKTPPMSLAQAHPTTSTSSDDGINSGAGAAAVVGNTVTIQKPGDAATASTILLPSGKTVPASARLPHSLRLVDSMGTTDVTVEVKGLTLDFVRRVGDLLDLILRDKLYMLRNTSSNKTSTNASGQPATASPAEDSIYQTISDIEDIRELLDLPDSSAGRTPSQDSGDRREPRDRGYSTDSQGSHSSSGTGRGSETAERSAAQPPSGPVLMDFTVTAPSAQQQPTQSSNYAAMTSSTAAAGTGRDGPAVTKSDSSHLLELEDFFSELNSGSNSAGGGGTPVLRSAHPSGVFNNPAAPPHQDVSSAAMSAPRKAEMDIFDDLIFGTTAGIAAPAPPAAAQVSAAAPPPAPAIVPAATTQTSTTSSAASTIASAPTTAEPAKQAADQTSPAPVLSAAAPAGGPPKKSLAGNIQKFLAQSQAQKGGKTQEQKNGSADV